MSPEILSYHSLLLSTQPNNAIFSLTIIVSFEFKYFLYEGSIPMRIPDKYLFSLISTS
jgi:hypothetical protein